MKKICFRMEIPRKHAEDTDFAVHTASEKYYRKPARDDEEEMDVDYLGLSSHS